MKNYKECSTYKEIKRNKARLNAMSFGDEGGVWACIDYDAELREECEGCENYRCPYND